MFLGSPTQTLEISFRVKHEEGSYMLYASSGSMRCFECGDVGHKRFACAHYRERTQGHAADPDPHPNEADAGEGCSEQAREKDAQDCQVGDNVSCVADLNTQLETAKENTVETDTPATIIDASCSSAGATGQDESRSSPAQAATCEGAASSEKNNLTESRATSDA